ncbi:choice-of-anchor Q domain-containing protein [Stratiformator vulcanicus]|uniref:choice-of-anchor Q domain-containing protein n=1 Tax=Stratiformator vulcanicus TaxID=2527980 RepID=UPI0011A5C633|nr:choice-of-anchor Q domain-containing protein [Stratiformator vulcanicus]
MIATTEATIVAYNTIFADSINAASDASGSNAAGLSPGIVVQNSIIETGGGILSTFGTAVDPGLEPLTDNGGPTNTHAITPGSAAIDAGLDNRATEEGSNGSTPLASDQRGEARFFSTVDIGAFEFIAPDFTNPITLAADGNADDLQLKVDTNAGIVQLFDGTILLAQEAIATLDTPIIVNGEDGIDSTLTVDFDGDTDVFKNGLTFNGGTGGNDELVLTNGNFTTTTYNATNANDGNIVLDDGTTTSTITYTGLEPISNTGTATDIIFNLTGSTDTAVLEDFGTANDGQMRLRDAGTAPGTFEDVVFNVTGGTSLTINLGDGDDSLTVVSVDDAFALAFEVNGDGGDDDIIVDAALTTGLTSIDLTAEGIVVNQDVTTTGDQFYRGDTQLVGDATTGLLTLTGANVTFTENARGTSANVGTHLVINAAGGVIDFQAGVGNGTGFEDFDVTADQIILGGSLVVDGDGATGVTAAQTIELNGDVILSHPTTTNFNIDINDGLPGNDYSLLITGDVNADSAANNRRFSVSARGGEISIQGAIGNDEALADLGFFDSASGNNSDPTIRLAGDVTVTGASGNGVVEVEGTLLLDSNVVFNLGSSDLAIFDGIENGSAVSGLTVDTTGDIAVDGAIGANAAIGAVTITNANDVDFQSTIEAASLTQSAGAGTTTLNGGTIGGAVNVTTDEITLNSGTLAAGGAVELTAQNGDINFSGGVIDATGQAVTLNANGAITGGPVGGVPDLTAGTITMNTGANGIGVSGTPLEISASGRVDAATVAPGADFFITSIGDLHLGQLNAGTGTIQLTAAGTSSIQDVVQNNDDVSLAMGLFNLIGSHIDLVAGGGIGDGEELEVRDSLTLKAVAQGGGVGLNANAGNDLTLTDVQSNGGKISFEALGTGNIIVQSMVATGGSVEMSSFGTGKIIAQSVVANGGSVEMRATGAVEVGSITSDGVTGVTITSGEAITDGSADDSAANIIAGQAILNAATGIGSAAANGDLNTTVSQLDLTNTTSGGVFITNAGALELIDLDGDAATRRDGNFAGGGVITATSPLTISSNMTFAGSMSFIAGDDNTANDDDLTVNAAVSLDSATDSTFLFQAGDDVILGANGLITTASAAHTIQIIADHEGATGTDTDRGGVTQTSSSAVTISRTTGTATLIIDSAEGVGTTANALRTTIDTLDVDDTDSGDIVIIETDAVTVNQLDQDGSGAVSLTAGGTITVASGQPGVSATTGQITLNSTVADIVMQDGSTISSTEGDAVLIAANNISLSQVNLDSDGINAAGKFIAAADVSLSDPSVGVGAIFDNNSGVTAGVEDANIIAAEALFFSADGIGVTDDIDTATAADVTALTIAALTDAGDINISNTDSLAVGQVSGASIVGGATGVTIANGAATDDVTLIASGDLRIAQSVTNNGGGDANLLSEANVELNASIQLDSTGDINVVAGWDGSTGLTGTTFNIAAVFADDSTYGIGGGSVAIGDGNQANGIAVGSKTGATNVAATDLELTGNDAASSDGFAQLGFHVASTDPVTAIAGAIRIDLTGNLSLDAGAGATSNADAGIGHGGAGSDGTRQGNIDLTVAGEASLVDGATAEWFIGHRTIAASGITNSDVSLATGTLDYSDATTSIDFTINQDFANRLGLALAGGELTIVATGDPSNAAGDDGNLINNGTWTANAANLLRFESTGDIAFNGPVTNSGAGALEVAAAANGIASVLANLSFATGGVTFESGTVHGTAAVTGDATIQTGVTLTAGAMPQDSIGQLTFNNDLSLQAGSTFLVEVNDTTNTAPTPGTDYDQIAVTGTTTIETTGAGVTLDFDIPTGGDAGINAGDVYAFLNSTGGVTGTFTGVADGDDVTAEFFDGAQANRLAFANYTGSAFTVSIQQDFSTPVTIINNGLADVLELRVDDLGDGDASNDVLQLFDTGQLIAEELVDDVIARGTTIVIVGESNVDTSLEVDLTVRGEYRQVGIDYDGGAGGAAQDSLALIDGTTTYATVTHSFASASSGDIILDDGTLTSTISYTGLEPIDDDLNATDRVFEFTAAAETITLSDDGDANDNESTIDSTLGESVTFINPTDSITIDTTAGSGADTVNIQGVDAQFDADLIITADRDAGEADTVNFQTAALDTNGGSITVATAETINVSTAVVTDGGTVSFSSGSANFLAGSSVATTDATIDVFADAIDINGTASINSGVAVTTLAPLTDGIAINAGLGATDAAGTLGLDDAELDQITASELVIGRDAAGAITTVGTVVPAGTSALTFVSGATVDINSFVGAFTTRIYAVGDVTTTGTATLQAAASLSVVSTAGSIDLCNTGSPHVAGTFAASAAGFVHGRFGSFFVSIGTVLASAGDQGLFAGPIAGVTSGSDATVASTQGDDIAIRAITGGIFTFANITANGDGNILLRSDAGFVGLNAAVIAAGDDVGIEAAGNVTQNASGAITADVLGVRSTSDNINLAAVANNVSTLAAEAQSGSSISFRAANALEVDTFANTTIGCVTIAEINGVSIQDAGNADAGGDVLLNVGGGLTVNESVLNDDAGQIRVITDPSETITIAAGEVIEGQDLSFETSAITGDGTVILNLDDDNLADEMRLFIEAGTGDLVLTNFDGTNTSELFRLDGDLQVEFVINAEDGEDSTLTIDSTNGNPVPVSGITFNGQGGNNSLVGLSNYLVTGSNSGSAGGVTFNDVANLAGTTGDDAFTFENAGSISGSIDGLGGSDTLTGDDDGNVFVVDTAQGGTLTGKIGGTFSGIENLVGGAADDTFTYDRTNGATGDISVDGAGQATGTTGDALIITDPNSAVAPDDARHIYTFTTTNANGHAGTFAYDDDATDPVVATITFAGLEPITNSGTATDVIFNLTGGVDSAVLQNNVAAGFIELVDTGAGLGTFVDTVFAVAGVSSTTINLGGGNDGFTLRALDPAFTASLNINGGGGNNTVTLDFLNGDPIPAGGFVFDGGTEDDTFVVNLRNFDVSALDGKSVTFNGGLPDITPADNNPGDTLEILQDATSNVETIQFEYTNLTDGFVRVDGLDADTAFDFEVIYTGLDPILSTINAQNVTLNYLSLDPTETITIQDNLDGTMEASSTAGEFTTFNTPTVSLTVNSGVGDDLITYQDDGTDEGGAANNFNAALTIDGQDGVDRVNLNDDLILGSDAVGNTGNLTVLAETIFVGRNAGLDVAIDTTAATTNAGTGGLGNVRFLADRSGANFSTDAIRLNLNSSITTTGDGVGNGFVDLDVVIDATTTGDFSGIFLRRNANITSEFGPITLDGFGGPTGSNNVGVQVDSGSMVTSTGTGANAATIKINGTATGTGNGNDGVRVAAAGSEVSSVDGDIAINGTGSNGGLENDGVEVSFGAVVTASGDGSIAITGDASGVDDNVGVRLLEFAVVSQTNTSATTATVTITGTAAGTGEGNVGVVSENAETSSEFADILIDGTGSANGTSENDGVQILDESTVESTGAGAGAALITIIGVGGGDDFSNEGVVIGGGNTLIASDDGAVLITGTGGGGAVAGSDENDGVTITNGAEISSTGTGANAATITIEGTASAGGGDNNGVNIIRLETLITSVDGAISITGEGGGGPFLDTGFNGGVFIEDAEIISTGTGTEAATITILGTGGEGENDNNGVFIGADTAAVISTDGDITITGIAGGNVAGGDVNHGVVVAGGASVTSNGDAAIAIAGTGGGSTGNSDDNNGVLIFGGNIESTSATSTVATITIDGTGTAADDRNNGVLVTDGGTITSNNADIKITGTSGGTGATSDDNDGVEIELSDVIAAGDGAVTITGTGTGRNGNEGVRIDESLVETEDGDLTIIGETTGTGNLNDGVEVTFDSEVTVSGDGSILIDGTVTAGMDDNVGVRIIDVSGVTHTNGNPTAATVTILGVSNATGIGNDGVAIEDADVTSEFADVTITGTAGANGIEDNVGVRILSGAFVASFADGADAAAISITGTGGINASGDFNDGVRIGENGGVEISSIDGAIAIEGFGGTGVDENIGVLIFDGALVESFGDGTDAATITITGTGGGDGDDNDGVRVDGTDTLVASLDGDIAIRGTGAGAGELNDGVEISFEAVVTASGDASIAIDGAAPAGTSVNVGVSIIGGAAVSHTNGDPTAATVTITGRSSGTETDNYGVEIADAAVTTGFADLLIGGRGSTDGTDFNAGVLIIGGSLVESSGTGTEAATVTIIGAAGGDGSDNDGVAVVGFDTFVASIDGDIEITGTGGGADDRNDGVEISVEAVVVAEGDASITIDGTGGGTAAGSEDNNGVAILNGAIVDHFNDQPTTATVTITGTAGGLGDGNDGVEIDDAAVLSDFADIFIKGTGGGSAETGVTGNDGVEIEDGAEVISFGDGPGAATITIIGQGGEGESENDGVQVVGFGSLVESTDGDILILGTGGANTLNSSNNNRGVVVSAGGVVEGLDEASIEIDGLGGGLSGTDSNVGALVTVARLSTEGGDLTVTGTSRAEGELNHGVLFDFAIVATTEDGDISVEGTGGAGASESSSGVEIINGSLVRAFGSGDVAMTGTARGTGEDNDGVEIDDSTVRTSAGGTINIEGTGTGTNLTDGVQIEDAARILSVNGTITVQGTSNATGTDNNGVLVAENSEVASTGGSINVTGISNFGTDDVAGTLVVDSSIRSVDGNLTVVGRSSATGNRNAGASFDGATVGTTGIGSILIDGETTAGDSQIDGVEILRGSQISAQGSGDLTVNGRTSGTGTDNNGVFVDTSVVATQGGNLIVSGGATAGTSSTDGVALDAATIRSGAGSLFIGGVSDATGNNSHGIEAIESVVRVTGNGVITLVGNAGSGAVGNVGVEIDRTVVSGEGLGAVTVVGTGQNSDTNDGVLISGSPATQAAIRSVAGPIFVTSLAGDITVSDRTATVESLSGSITVNSARDAQIGGLVGSFNNSVTVTAQRDLFLNDLGTAVSTAFFNGPNATDAAIAAGVDATLISRTGAPAGASTTTLGIFGRVLAGNTARLLANSGSATIGHAVIVTGTTPLIDAEATTGAVEFDRGYLETRDTDTNFVERLVGDPPNFTGAFNNAGARIFEIDLGDPFLVQFFLDAGRTVDTVDGVRSDAGLQAVVEFDDDADLSPGGGTTQIVTDINSDLVTSRFGPFSNTYDEFFLSGRSALAGNGNPAVRIVATVGVSTIRITEAISETSAVGIFQPNEPVGIVEETTTIPISVLPQEAFAFILPERDDPAPIFVEQSIPVGDTTASSIPFESRAPEFGGAGGQSGAGLDTILILRVFDPNDPEGYRDIEIPSFFLAPQNRELLAGFLGENTYQFIEKNPDGSERAIGLPFYVRGGEYIEIDPDSTDGDSDSGSDSDDSPEVITTEPGGVQTSESTDSAEPAIDDAQSPPTGSDGTTARPISNRVESSPNQGSEDDAGGDDALRSDGETPTAGAAIGLGSLSVLRMRSRLRRADGGKRELGSPVSRLRRRLQSIVGDE